MIFRIYIKMICGISHYQVLGADSFVEVSPVHGCHGLPNHHPQHRRVETDGPRQCQVDARPLAVERLQPREQREEDGEDQDERGEGEGEQHQGQEVILVVRLQEGEVARKKVTRLS